MNKTPFYVALAITLGLLSGCANLTEQDYARANWIKDHVKGNLYTFYMSEQILHTTEDYHLYLDRVKKKNNGKLEGKLLLPDLDNNGRVGR